ncbi:MAG: hypothetical protein AAF962_22500 [Actinomycetota bacterium]
MADQMTADAEQLHGGHTDLDYRETADWGDFQGTPSNVLLFGDPECGPFAFFSSSAPMEEKMPTGFAHGHASDNWRISVRGTTDMGRDSYAHGQFRFHDGGAPYPGDNLAWGPDGGFGLVLFGDRRGFAIQPVKAEIREQVRRSQEQAAARLGIDMLDRCPDAPAIATTEGTTRRAHLNSGFDAAASWPEAAPGVRLFVGLMGERERGPVVCLVDAAPGTVALPARTLATETLLLPVGGSVGAGGETLDQGSIRLEHADVAAAPLVAGDAGVQLVAIVGDRRALAAALDTGALAAGDLATALASSLTDLSAQLT